MPSARTCRSRPAVEIGWRLSGRWQGKGLARESAEEAMRFGFEDFGLDRIVAYTRPQNTPSWGLMVRLGMSHAGDFHHPNLPEGHPMRPHVLYEKRR